MKREGGKNAHLHTHEITVFQQGRNRKIEACKVRINPMVLLLGMAARHYTATIFIHIVAAEETL